MKLRKIINLKIECYKMTFLNKIIKISLMISQDLSKLQLP
jgi:hypothetical protein